jgi:hypothetical protein
MTTKGLLITTLYLQKGRAKAHTIPTAGDRFTPAGILPLIWQLISAID